MALQRDADRLLAEGVADGVVPGVVAMATDARNSFYTGEFGERALGSGEPMTADTVMWIASMTKPMAAAAAMQLVERGELDLDAPASVLAPWLGEAQVLEGFGADGAPRLRPPAREITLRHLLTHSSGFGYTFWNAGLKRFNEMRERDGSDRLDSLRMPLVFDPGTDWQYGIGIDWAGVMVEEASGMSLGAFMAANLFEPLGMADTAFHVPTGRRGRLARMHRKTADGIGFVDRNPPESAPELEGGGGGIYSTMNDYVRFIRMILNEGCAGGEQVLKPETVRRMSVNQMGGLRVHPLKSQAPELTCDVDIFPGIEKSWGLSFMINEDPAPTGRSAGSLAWAGLANSHFWIDPARGVGGIFATQMFPFVEAGVIRLYQDYEKCVYDSLD
ncbi:MAG: 1,4-butanediol diacrylate esterase [Rhizobiales bacterium NRL2]|jgi:CubicO group peptidase (beta-lactamase class C family)|nr:MAG: 1,4-butanediol diacrylate esterase [Rhizobiales bacterium NRL2]